MHIRRRSHQVDVRAAICMCATTRGYGVFTNESVLLTCSGIQAVGFSRGMDCTSIPAVGNSNGKACAEHRTRRCSITVTRWPQACSGGSSFPRAPSRGTWVISGLSRVGPRFPVAFHLRSWTEEVHVFHVRFSRNHTTSSEAARRTCTCACCVRSDGCACPSPRARPGAKHNPTQPARSPPSVRSRASGRPAPLVPGGDLGRIRTPPVGCVRTMAAERRG